MTLTHARAVLPDDHRVNGKAQSLLRAEQLRSMCLSLLAMLAFTSACGQLALSDDAPPPSPSPARGGVIITSITDDDGTTSLSVNPYFPVAAWMPPPFGGRRADGVECQALRRSEDAPRPRDSDAGVIAVVARAGVQVSLEWEAEAGRYMARYPGNGVRADGVESASIELDGAGSAEAPAFHATVPPLAELRITSPRKDEVVGTGAADFALRWTTSDPTPITMTLEGSTGAITCTFDARRGYGVVPGALMKDAFSSAPEYPCIGCARLTIVRELVTQATSDGYDLDIRRAERRLTRLTMKP